MIKEKLKVSVILAMIMLMSSGLFAQWQQDNDYKFKINVPESWSKNSYIDGTDKVYDFMSPDENAAIQLRAFEATPQFTTDLLVQVYEESMLPQGAERISLANHISKQGIRGKQGIYSFDYNGTPVSMAVFFTIQKDKGFVISVMIPTNMLQRKTAEVKQITESFTLIGTSQNNGNGALVGLNGGTMISKFKIKTIQMCSSLDNNNNAINPGTSFNSQTPEIHAVISYTGQTSSDLTVSWVYVNWNRTITSDKYNFKGGQGGIGVVSLSKPNNGWPVGNYEVKFEMDGKELDTKIFEITEQKKNSGLSGLTGGTTKSGKISGRYDLVSRSDNNNGYNFLYLTFNDDGTVVEKHQPKDSGGYIGEHKGLWKVKGNMLEITFDWGTYAYEINGNTIKHKDKQGVISIYKKK